jgi:hypothetical protein
MAFTLDNQSQNIFSKLKSMAPAKRFGMLRDQQRMGAASPFTLLTPLEFAELFPKYYLKGMPEVKGFYDALSKKKGGTLAEGEATTSSGASVSSSEKVTNVVKAKEIYDYIRSKGIDHVHAAGIVNNMKYESNFNSGAIGDGGTSGGLFQHHASRFSAMKQYVGDGWQTNWKKQIDFAMTEGDMKTYLSRNFANPADASIGFTKDFERPANTETTAMYRSHTAGGYSEAMLGKTGEPSGAQTPGGNYEMTSNGYVVPKNKEMYDSKNEEQCATLSKGMNPDLGRTSGWTVVEGPIRPGVVVATTRYNLPGGDRMGAGYHTGVAMTAPDDNGNFLLLEQFKGQKPQLRQVNKDSYSGGALGGSVKFGLVQSNGKLHDEQSKEALQFGANLADDEQKKKILSNMEALDKGGTTGAAGTGSGSVEYKTDETSQNQNNFEQQQSTKYASTAHISDVVRSHTGQIGEIMGFISMITGRGEGIGSGEKYRPEVSNTGLNTNSNLIDYKGSKTANKLGVTDAQYNAFREALASIESSGGKYELRGGSSNRFSGAYQIGGKELEEIARRLGEQAPVTKVKGKRTPVANEQFIKDPKMQERYFDEYNAMHHERLMKNKKYAAMPPEKKLEVLGVAHNAGAGAASKYVRTGNVKSDAFGTRPTKYSDRIAMHLDALNRSSKADGVKETAQVKSGESLTAKITKPLRELLVPGTASAETKPAAGTSTTEVFERMRKMKSTTAPVPEVKSTIEYAAPGMFDENFTKQQDLTPAQPEKRSMMEKPQNPVSINALEQRASHMQPTPSLARAMNNTRGITDSSYTSLTNTKLG